MTKISDFASQGQAAIDAAIQEIEKNLQDSNLPESVLGSN
jgi:hypothetical protein